jgi:HlyD family secretion protein
MDTTPSPLMGKARKLNPWMMGLVAAGLLGTTAVVLLQSRNPPTTAEQVAALTVPVESSPLTVRIRASGKVQPVRTVNVSPATSDIVEELLVEQGDRVEAGQVIARMKNDTLQAEVAQAQARVAQAQARLDEALAGNRPQDIAQGQARVEQAQANVAQAEARLNLANDRVERNRFLEGQGAVSQDTLDGALNEAATARASLAQAQAALREAERSLELLQSGSRSEQITSARAQLQEALAGLESAQVRLDDSFVRAPFSGIVTQRYATAGAFVAPTTTASAAAAATSSAIIALAEGLEVLAEVPEVDISQIRAGQQVEIVADAYPSEVFQGRVRLIAPEAVVEQNVTSFQVRIELLTGLDQLRSQMNVDAVFLGDQVENALVVPTVAIVTQGGETGVLVPDQDNRIRFQPVTLGPAVGNQTQILDGVTEGDRIFIDLPPGQSLENLNFGRRPAPRAESPD